MKKSLQIVGVRTIFNIDKPIVVFEVAGHEAIVRNPKQALTDLQNSGRALDINANALTNSIEGLDPSTKASFVQALLDCIGAVLAGDIQSFSIGDEYAIREGHPAVTNQAHPMFGKVKIGDKLKAETNGVWVEGFLSIPLTEQEKMRRDISGNISKAIMQMYGFGATVPAPVAVPQGNAFGAEEPEVAGAIPSATADEAFGTSTANAKGTK